MKETPSAEGHTGGVVAAAGAADDEVVGSKLVDGEAVEIGLVDGLLELDNDGVSLMEPGVLGGAICEEELDR